MAPLARGSTDVMGRMRWEPNVLIGSVLAEIQHAESPLQFENMSNEQLSPPKCGNCAGFVSEGNFESPKVSCLMKFSMERPLDISSRM